MTNSTGICGGLISPHHTNYWCTIAVSMENALTIDTPYPNQFRALHHIVLPRHIQRDKSSLFLTCSVTKKFHFNYSFPKNATLWTKLLSGCFPDRYKLNLSKSIINSYPHNLHIRFSSYIFKKTSFSITVPWVALGGLCWVNN